MNRCDQLQFSLTEYLDGRLTGREMQEIGAHLQACRECAREFESLRELKTALATLGPVPEPADLPLRIRVAVSQERARSHRSVLTFFDLAWKNSVGPFLLQAGAGFAGAVLVLGTIVFLITMFAQPQVSPMPRATTLRSSSPVPWSLRPTSTARAKCTTTASFRVLRTPPRALRWRTCCSSAASLQPASTASLFADWQCCSSPASRSEADRCWLSGSDYRKSKLLSVMCEIRRRRTAPVRLNGEAGKRFIL